MTNLFTSAVNKNAGNFVIGPDGHRLSFADLPPPDTKRWVIRRKAEVVAAVQGGLLTLDEACERYNLTTEEFLGWQHAISRYGIAGLRATRTQHYRETQPTGTERRLFPPADRARGFDELARHHHDRHRVLLGADFGQHLHAAQFERCGRVHDLVGGFAQLARGFHLGLGLDDAAALFAQALRLPAPWRAAWRRDLHILHLDVLDFHAPALRSWHRRDP